MSDTPKKLADILRTAAGCLKNRTTTAIIVAGGSSTRMGGDVPKQFLDLCGMPVAVHAMRAYEECEYIDHIIVVAREEDCSNGIYDRFAEKFGITKYRGVVAGGASRQQSVLCGIEALPKGTAYVAIADAARPLTAPRLISSVCLAAYRHGAASAAFPAVDTIKVADKHCFVTETVERSTVWQAATPQVFGLALYRAAAYSALDEGFECTDDNSLVEHIGYKVKLVNCGRYNIKITEKFDLAIAEALLSMREDLLREAEEEDDE